MRYNFSNCLITARFREIPRWFVESPEYEEFLQKTGFGLKLTILHCFPRQDLTNPVRAWLETWRANPRPGTLEYIDHFVQECTVAGVSKLKDPGTGVTVESNVTNISRYAKASHQSLRVSSYETLTFFPSICPPLQYHRLSLQKLHLCRPFHFALTGKSSPLIYFNSAPKPFVHHIVPVNGERNTLRFKFSSPEVFVSAL